MVVDDVGLQAEMSTNVQFELKAIPPPDTEAVSQGAERDAHLGFVLSVKIMLICSNLPTGAQPVQRGTAARSGGRDGVDYTGCTPSRLERHGDCMEPFDYLCSTLSFDV